MTSSGNAAHELNLAYTDRFGAKTSMGCCRWHGLLRREEIGCLTVKITSFPARP
jgi:hypothetical protein